MKFIRSFFIPERRNIMRVTVEINDEMAKAIKLYMTKASNSLSSRGLKRQPTKPLLSMCQSL